MYSRKAWGGPVDPYVLVKFIQPEINTTTDSIVSLVIFEWQDVDLIGILPPDALLVLSPNPLQGLATNKD